MDIDTTAVQWAAGAVSSAAAVGLLLRFTFSKVWQMVERQSAVIENHIAHSTAMQAELRDAVRELTTTLQRLPHKVGAPPISPPNLT